MTVVVTFHRDDTAGWAAFEDKVGHSHSNRDHGPDWLDLIWKEVPEALALRFTELACRSPGALALQFIPPPMPMLRLVE